jgi:hypothetical protein
MKTFLLNIPIAKLSFIVAVAALLFITFFITPTYKAESIIDVNNSEEGLTTSSLASSFIQNDASSDAYQVKLYLESNESIDLLKNSYEIDNYFKHENISYFSQYKSERQNFYKYIENKINIIVDGESDTITIETHAYNRDDAKMFNLSVVDITANFFNRKARLAAINSRSGKICELFLANSGVIGLEIGDLDQEDQIEIDQINSLNDLLIIKAETYRDYCINRINNQTDIESTNEYSLSIPAFELRTINAGALKNIISALYEDSMGIISEASYIDVIAEPVVADMPESKSSIVISIIVFFFSSLILITIKIFIRLTDEFNF